MVVKEYNLQIDAATIFLDMERVVLRGVGRLKRLEFLKRKALERVVGEEQEEADNGYYHLDKALTLQREVLPRQEALLAKANVATIKAKRNAEELQPLPKSARLVQRWRFSGQRSKLIVACEELHTHILECKSKIHEVTELVDSQRVLFSDVRIQRKGRKQAITERKRQITNVKGKQVMAGRIKSNVGFLETDLTEREGRRLRELIGKELEAISHAIKAYKRCLKPLRIIMFTFARIWSGTVAFLIRLKRSKGANIIDESQAASDILENRLSLMYALTMDFTIIGLLAYAFAPQGDIRAALVALGVFALGTDKVQDLITVLPEYRRRAEWVGKKIGELRKEVDEETKEVLALSKGTVGERKELEEALR